MRLGRWIWKRRRRLGAGLALLVLSPVVLIGVMACFTALPAELQEPAAPSIRVLARNGQLLREVRTDDGSRSRPLPLAEFPEQVRQAVLAAEDRRFYGHHGVDVEAALRAAIDDVLARRIVSGASTITMQLARTVRPHPRTVWGKIGEMALALRIEASLSKDRILEEYLNRVGYGPNLRGYATASRAYFASPPESLSLAQAALIAGLPRGPSLYDVAKHPKLAQRRRDRVLDRMLTAGMIDAAARDRAVAEPLAATLERPAFGAPHFVRGLLRGAVASKQPGLVDRLEQARRGGSIAELESTIDPGIQRAAEAAVTATLANLGPKHVTAAAVVVLENATGDVLAWVGSPDFHGAAILGQNDGVLALRQPGSSLKPFVYAEAMATLGYGASTIVPDVELHIALPGGGDYVPHDYDGKLRGPVRLREALGNSLNIPAVDTIHKLGTTRALDRMRAFGITSLTEDAEHYGPALALGDGEITLLELTNAYAALARGGLYRPVRVVTAVGDQEIEPGPAIRVLDERYAAILTDILADKTARMAAFGDQNVLELDFEVAAKTGTSKGYRDNVAVGYTREITVGVWAGNFDGSPMAEVSGVTGAGPIFHDTMLAAAEARPPSRDRGLMLAHDPGAASRLGLARTAVCSLSGEIATTSCPHRMHEWLPEGSADHAPPCSVHERVHVDDETVRVVERWPPPFDEWARRTGRAVAPEEERPTTAPGGLRIIYPFDGARFAIDPERATAMQLLDVTVEPNAPDVRVAIDGAPLNADRRWPLTAGEHVIVAQRGDAASTPVRITVH